MATSSTPIVHLEFRLPPQKHAAVPPFTAPEEFRKACHVGSREQYDEMYKRSIEDPEGFWGDIADQFHWEKKVTGTMHESHA